MPNYGFLFGYLMHSCLQLYRIHICIFVIFKQLSMVKNVVMCVQNDGLCPVYHDHYFITSCAKNDYDIHVTRVETCPLK
jgi:hypothetical protein